MKLLSKCLRTAIEHLLEKFDVVNCLLETEQVQRFLMLVFAGALWGA